MSRWSYQAAKAALAAVVFLAATAHAADPNAPPTQKAKPKVVARPSVSKPATPAKRTPASFTPQMPFGEAMDILRNSTTPPMNIVVLWKEIGENAGIYRETPIGIDGVPGLRASQYLELLLLSLSGGASAKLGYTVKDGIVTVGTTGSLRPTKRVTRVYDVSDLVAEPARYFFMPMAFGGMGLAGAYGGGYGGGGPASSMYGLGGMPGMSTGQGLVNGMNTLYGGGTGSGGYRR